MKIAIQLFGHMRTYKQCYRALFDNLISQYDCDVFIHTWDKIDHNTTVWHNYHVTSNDGPEKLKSDIINTYNPKKICMESQNPVDMGCVTANGYQISKFGIKSMLYGMSMANDLRKQYQKETGVEYDVVIVTRPDIILHKPLVLEKYIKPYLPKKSLYTVGSYKCRDIVNDWRFIGASDVLFFATPDVMDNIFSNTDDIFQQILNPDTTQYGPEYSFIYAIQNMGISVFLINYLWRSGFEILRPQTDKKTSWFGRIFKRK